MVYFHLCCIINNNVVGWCYCSLANMLRYQEEIVPENEVHVVVSEFVLFFNIL